MDPQPKGLGNIGVPQTIGFPENVGFPVAIGGGVIDWGLRIDGPHNLSRAQYQRTHEQQTLAEQWAGGAGKHWNARSGEHRNARSLYMVFGQTISAFPGSSHAAHAHITRSLRSSRCCM